MVDFQATWQTILTVCGGIAVIIGAVKLQIDMFRPQRKLREKVEHHERCFEENDKRIKRNDAAIKVLLRAAFALIDHALTGNSIETLKETRDKIREFLSEI